jgi:protein arginine kinase
LIEKHLLSPEFAMSKKENQAMLINEEENICIMINEEDHIRMQVFAAGFDLENLLNLSIELDQKLENLINYAYSEKYGYLTSCLTNIGTGIRASVMVHLPALTITGNINAFVKID